MVEFAGYDMPLQYRLGIKGEHLHTRSKSGLFDVSHMGQVVLRGESVLKDLEKLVPSDLQALEVGGMRYTVFTNEWGGIIDDLIVTRCDGYVLLVLNAAFKETDIRLIRKNLNCEIEVMTDSGLLALQGPASEKILNEIIPGVKELFFLQAAEFTFAGSPIIVSRSGYTGEDGFEISIPKKNEGRFTEILLRDLKTMYPDVNLIGIRVTSAREFSNFLRKYGVRGEEIYKKARKDKTYSLKDCGYDTYFGIIDSALSNDGEFEVQEDATKAQIKRAFVKSLKAKKLNKKVLGEFVELVA